MAPVPPMGRERVIERVERGELPFSFGSPHPCVMILEEEGRVRLRELVVDPAEAARASAEALARKASWMPEHHYALARPTGTIHADAASRAELVLRLRELHWPPHW